jgi:hypothetical protein
MFLSNFERNGLIHGSYVGMLCKKKRSLTMHWVALLNILGHYVKDFEMLKLIMCPRPNELQVHGNILICKRNNYVTNLPY